MTRTPLSVVSLAVLLALGCEGKPAPEASTAQAPAPAPVESVTPAPPADAPVIRTASLRVLVTGMHCGGCASTVESTLAAREDVAACRVSFEESLAEVELREGASVPEILAAIRELGYEVETTDEAS